MAMTPEQEKEYYHEQRIHSTGNEANDIYDKLAREGAVASDPRFASQGERAALVSGVGRVGEERVPGSQGHPGASPAEAGGAPTAGIGGIHEPQWMAQDRAQAGAEARQGMMAQAAGGLPLAQDFGMKVPADPVTKTGLAIESQVGQFIGGGAVAGKFLARPIAGFLGQLAAKFGPKAAQEAAESITKEVGDLADHVKGAKEQPGVTKPADPDAPIQPDSRVSVDRAGTATKGPSIGKEGMESRTQRAQQAAKDVNKAAGGGKTVVGEGKNINVTAGKTKGGRDVYAMEKKGGGVGAKPGQKISQNVKSTGSSQPKEGTQPRASTPKPQPEKDAGGKPAGTKTSSARDAAAKRTAEAQQKWRDANPGKPDPEGWSKGAGKPKAGAKTERPKEEAASREQSKAPNAGKNAEKLNEKKVVKEPRQTRAGAARQKAAKAAAEAKKGKPANEGASQTAQKAHEEKEATPKPRTYQETPKGEEVKAVKKDTGVSENVQKRREAFSKSKELPDAVWSVADRIFKSQGSNVSRGTAEKAWSEASTEKRMKMLEQLSEDAKKLGPQK